MESREYDRAAIGRRLKSGIVDRGLTAEQLADAIGVSRHTVTEWVNGRTGMSLENAVKVCDELGWPIDRLAVRTPPQDAA